MKREVEEWTGHPPNSLREVGFFSSLWENINIIRIVLLVMEAER